MSASRHFADARPWAYEAHPSPLRGIVFAPDLGTANATALEDALERVADSLAAGVWSVSPLDLSDSDARALYQAELRRLRDERTGAA